MTRRPKLSIHEYFLICIAVQKFAGSNEIANSALDKLATLTDFREPEARSNIGRPRKEIDESVDVQRAKVIQSLKEKFPNDTTKELIEVARIHSRFAAMIEENTVPEELLDVMPSDLREKLGKPQPLSGLFPANQDLKSSVSRGKKALSARPPKLRKT